MKNLFDAECRAELRMRLGALEAGDTRRWGVLTVEEMMAHVRQAYVVTTSGRMGEPIPGPVPQGVMKFLALSLPLPWPKSVQTTPRLRREAMPPAESFDEEHGRLMEAYEHFLTFDSNTTRHPMLGPMKPADWMRWGYLHADHHLRQFGR